MENSIKKPLIVEFYGLPGCGKSTISHLVASKLRDEGYVVEEPSYEMDRNCSPLFRKLKKLSIYLYCFVLHNNTFKRVRATVDKNGYSGIARVEQASNVLQKISVYRDIRYNKIVIWDQGLVQASISLSLNGVIQANENLKSLLHILDSNVEVKYVLISVDEHVALERMSQRPTNDSRVEKLKDGNQKLKMLQRFQDSINIIRSHKTSIIVNGEDSLEDQVVQITKELLSNSLK